MFARRKAAKRFSLLLLEDEEDYIADWVASCKWPDAVKGNWQGLARLPGRLRLCTRSLFFEPDDVRVPVVRLDFSSVVQLEAEGMQALVVGVTKVTKMKPSTADVPYVVERNCTSIWHFSLTYAKLDSVMPLAQEQLVISRLPTADRLSLLATSAKAREDAAQFDSSRLVEFSEHLVWEGPAVQLTPLVREPGRLAVTDQRLYFQPLHNIAGDVPVRSHPLAAVAAVVRRRSSLRPVGLELFLLQLRQLGSEAEGSPGPPQTRAIRGGPFWDTPSIFFSFRSEADRDQALSALTRQPALGAAVNSLVPVTPGEAAGSISRTVPGQQSQLVAAGQLLEAAGGWLGRVLSAWQQGKVSNFDYLLYLNLAAGRSFNDLAQWPVFPWVLRDYQSRELDLTKADVFRELDKPMGAQTRQRLEVFRQRYQEMESLVQHVGPGHDMPAPFMYGTHYSTPGYVMYWLVRAAPGHMLRLQGGRFDAPDRLFVSLKEAWHSATTSTTDVKELIPEFYMPGADFLVNGSQLALGIRQSGQPVHDVELPPWASSPAHLLAMHRAALEAPYVSAHLHQWIDLIFGFKQTGVAAVEADNVFFHLTYEGAVDVSQVTSLQELKALETQINEFGQTPKQLFTFPHPPRLVQPPAPDPTTVFSASEQVATSASISNSSSSSSSTVRLKGGGEDAAGGAICFALLKTILAAAAPDIQPAVIAGPDAGGATISVGRAEDDGLLSLSPVHSGDLLSASFSSSTPDLSSEPQWPDKRAVGSSKPTPPSGIRISQATAVGADPRQPKQQQPQQQRQASAGLMGLLSKLKDGAAAAAAGTVASVIPSNGAAATASTGSSSLKLSLSWMQQQFAEGMALKNAPSASSTQEPTSGQDHSAAAPPAPASAAAATSGGNSSSRWRQQPASAAAVPASWPSNLPGRLLVKKSVRLQSDPLTAVTATGNGLVVCVGHNGLLRVLDTPHLSAIRSAKLQDGADLLSVCLMPGAPPVHTAATLLPAVPAAAAAAAAAVADLPLILAGSQTGRLIAYAAGSGAGQGSCAAHEDGVSCMVQLGSSGAAAGSSRLATGSYDCSVKVWDVAEGRQPWSSSLAQPLAALELRDFDSGVWALSSSGSGQLLVSGSEEGQVAAWDLRTGQQIWAAQVSSDYVGGVSLLPGGNYVVAATADGAVSLLDWRRAGECITSASCDSPLRCCTCSSSLMISGTEAGQLLMWNLAQLIGQQPSSMPSLTPSSVSGSEGVSMAGPDGLYPPLSCGRRAAVNGVAVGVRARDGHASPSAMYTADSWNAVAAMDDGSLVLFSNK